MVAVLLALASSVAIGSTDFLAGYKARKVGVLTVLVVSQFSSLAILVAVFAIAGEQFPPGRDFALFAALSAVAQLAAVTAFWHGLTIGAMGVVAPITATGAAIPIAIGLAAGDRPSVLQLAAVTLAVIGVALASYEPIERREGDRPIAAGVGFALVAAVGIGVFYVAIAEASKEGSALSAALANRAVSAGVLVLPAVILRDRVSARRSDVPALVAVGALEITGIFLFAAAAAEGLLTIVGAIGALYPLSTVTLAWLVLHERLHRTQRLGALVAIAGIATIASTVAS